MSRRGSLLSAVLIAIVIGLMSILVETGSTQAGRPAPSPIPCQPVEGEAVRVWFVSVRRADGKMGTVMVNQPNWEAAGARAANLSDAEPQTIRAETFLVDQVVWSE